MPLAKNYLRYVPGDWYGVVASNLSNAVLLSDTLAAAPALEDVLVWNLRKGTKEQVLHGARHAVTCLTHFQAGTTSSGGDHAATTDVLAVGYEDGAIKLWDLQTGQELVTFSGHRAAVECLRFDARGVRLISGGQDTDVIVWDVVNESGLYRLRGHKGPVTEVLWLEARNMVISASKDSFVKYWDLDTQHCVSTIVGHRNEVYGAVLHADERMLITGTVDNELRVWDLFADEESEAGEEGEGGMAVDGEIQVKAGYKLRGSLPRQSGERVQTLQISPDGRLLLCQGADNTLEVYKIHSADEIKKRVARRLKRKRESRAKKGLEADQEEEALEAEVRIADEFKSVHTLKSTSRIRSFDLRCDKSGYTLLLALANNAMELYSLALQKKSMSVQKLTSVALPGHRSPIRACAFSSDETLIATTSNSGAKIWTRSSQKCFRTLDAGYGLCLAFIPGDQHILIGTRNGQLQLFDIASGQLLEVLEAHDGAIWSLGVHPDGHGFVTGGADNTVKFFDFELVDDEGTDSGGKRLSFAHVRTLKMATDVLAVKYSPNQKLLAVALLDATVKVFYADTLKFFLSLFGHKLPVLSVAFSSDSTLIATGSADKNIKIWGAEFGDCHKSFFAHQDSVTTVQFVGTTHYLFSTSKDKTIKYWDTDKFEHISTLEGHKGEVWCSAMTQRGTCLITGSHDKSIRTWHRTQELINLEEEREMERERAYDEAQAEEEAKAARAEAEGKEVGLAAKQTVETMLAAERIMEAVELAEKEKEKESDEPAHPLLVAFGNLSPADYVLKVLMGVKSSELEEALLVLPFSFVVQLLGYFDGFITAKQQIERVIRSALFLLEIHQNQILATDALLPVIANLHAHARPAVQALKDDIGLNFAALKFLRRDLEEKGISVFEDVEAQLEHVKKKRRKSLRST